MNKLVKKFYKKAKKVSIKNEYKNIAVLSDLHLGNGGPTDNSLHNNLFLFTALDYYYVNNYLVILNGDIFDIAECSLEDIKKCHEDIMWQFERLHEEGRLIYIRGNHDDAIKEKDLETRPFSYTKERAPFLPGIKVYDYAEVTRASKCYRILHGHQNNPKYVYFNGLMNFLIFNVWARLEKICAKEQTGELGSFTDNSKMIADFSSDDFITIVGHSHTVILNQKNYFNDGCGVFPRCVTAIEIEDTQAIAVKWAYYVGECGLVSVQRTVLG